MAFMGAYFLVGKRRSVHVGILLAPWLRFVVGDNGAVRSYSDFNLFSRYESMVQVIGAAQNESAEGTPAIASEHSSSGPEAAPKSLKLEFKGTASEYFRIWIVNLCLTLVTLGVFSAWAKVRKKRYFYSHTILDGTPFQYLANPAPILRGRIIAAVLFLSYYFSSHFFLQTLPYALASGLLLAPWVVSRSAIFNARYSAFRNMSFDFDGGYRAAAVAIFAWGVVPAFLFATFPQWWLHKKLIGSAILACLLLVPLWFRSLKFFIVSHTIFGGKSGTFAATNSQYFAIYFLAFAIVASVAIVTLLASASVLSNPHLRSHAHVLTTESGFHWVLAGMTYLGYVIAYGFVQANISNIAWDNVRLGDLRFHSTLSAMEMIGIYISNGFGILFSAGLLIPWAAVRMLRYRVNHLAVLADGELTEFQGTGRKTMNAIGAETMALFEFDISL